MNDKAASNVLYLLCHHSKDTKGLLFLCKYLLQSKPLGGMQTRSKIANRYLRKNMFAAVRCCFDVMFLFSASLFTLSVHPVLGLLSATLVEIFTGIPFLHFTR